MDEESEIERWLDPRTVRDFTLEAMQRRYEATRCWHLWRKRWRLKAGKRMCAACYTKMLSWGGIE